jgi:hypothetical protein
MFLGSFTKIKMEILCLKKMTKNPIAKDLRTPKYQQRVKPNKKKRKKYKELLEEMMRNAKEQQQLYRENYKRWEDDQN